MGKRGPPPKQINWDEFEKLVSFQCTQAEVAAFFDVDIKWLEVLVERHYGEKLTLIWSKKELFGRIRLRKIQMAIAEGKGPGAATMAIYLGKKRLPEQFEGDKSPDPDPGPAPGKRKKKTFEEFVATAGYPAPYPKQVEMFEFGISMGDPRLLLGARGYGKTDYVTVLGVAYDVYDAYFEDAFTSNLIISKSKSRNSAMIEEIANALIANGVMLEKQNSACIRVVGQVGKDHSVEALTIKSSFRGRHPKRIVMDDPVTEEDTSEAMRTLVKKKYDEAYKLCKNIVILGQPAHAFDLYAELRPSLQKMEIPHGSIPELDADLDAMRLAGVDEHSIQMSYMLKVPTDGHAIFSALRFIDKFPTGDSAVAMIDPSDGGDFTAVTVMKAYMDGVAIEGRAWKKAWYHCLDDMALLFKALGVKKICFETNCTGQQPITQLSQVFSPLGIGVTGKHSTTDKHASISSAGSYSHMIHLSKESSRVYTEQVTKYEYRAKYDDAPDSLARGLEWIGLLRGKK